MTFSEAINEYVKEEKNILFIRSKFKEVLELSSRYFFTLFSNITRIYFEEIDIHDSAA